MPTLILIEGWEHGVPVLVTSGGGLADLVTGTPTVVSGGRTSNYALEVDSNASAENHGRNFTASDIVVARGYIMFPSALPGADTRLVFFLAVAGAQLNLRYDFSSNVFKVDFQGGVEQLHSTTLVADTWYRIDLKITFNAATRTCDWKVNGVDGTQASFAVAASQGNRVRWGTSEATTATVRYDDWVISATSGDYPIGVGEELHLSPNQDGTHNAGVNIMEDSAGNDIGAVTAFNLLDDMPLSTGTVTDRIQQTANGTGNYAELQFEDLVGSPVVNGVAGLLRYQSASATGNNGATIARRSDSTEISIYGTPAVPADMSETSDFYKFAMITPPAGGWTVAEVNALLMRIGYSGDAAPDPYWLALMFEVDITPQAATSLVLKRNSNLMGMIVR